jgi:hypothetical protein
MFLAKLEEISDRLVVAFPVYFAEHLRLVMKRLAEFLVVAFGGAVHGERHDLLKLFVAVEIDLIAAQPKVVCAPDEPIGN